MNKSSLATSANLNHSQKKIGSLSISEDFCHKEERRSSDSTQSTMASDCESSDSGKAEKSIRKTKTLSTPGRKQLKKEKAIRLDKGKDVLVGLISKEMTNAWTVHDEAEPTAQDDMANLHASATSSADLFYAMMNGETIDPSNSADDAVHEPTFDFDDLEVDLDIENDFDQATFHNLAFSFSRSDDAYDTQVPMRERKARRSISEGSASNNSTSSVTTSGDSEVFSAYEIEQLVIQNVPLDVRNKIPKEAWRKIFGTSEADATTKPKTAKYVGKIESALDDNASDVSDITNTTEFVAKNGFTTKDKNCYPTVHGSWTTASLSQGSAPDSKSLTRPTNQNQLPDGSQEKGKDKKVSFANVQIRYYERMLDINPSVTAGPAIGIGWRYKKGGKVTIDEWEMSKGNNLSRSKDLLLPKHVRESMLKEAGFTQRDIAEAVRIIIKAKNKRKQTVQNLGVEAVEEVVESAARRVKSILSLGR